MVEISTLFITRFIESLLLFPVLLFLLRSLRLPLALITFFFFPRGLFSPVT